jgi:prepilin-type N-terminal cleavage/methylation domain-containing protein
LKRPRGGFSLTELVVVLAILILLAAAILPVIGPMRKRGRLRVASETVAGALRSARSLAIAQCAVYSVEFEVGTDPHQVRIWSGTGSKADPDRIEKLPGDTRLYSCSPAPPVQFEPDGSCRKAFTVAVRGADDREHRVKVSPASGYVKVVRTAK